MINLLLIFMIIFTFYQCYKLYKENDESIRTKL